MLVFVSGFLTWSYYTAQADHLTFIIPCQPPKCCWDYRQGPPLDLTSTKQKIPKTYIAGDGTQYVLGKCSATEVHPQPFYGFFGLFLKQVPLAGLILSIVQADLGFTTILLPQSLEF